MREKTYWIIISLVILSSLFLRIWNLDADPPWTKRAGDISDEGYWAHEARMKILTGTFTPDQFLQGLASGPLTTTLIYGSFKLFGINLFSLRLVAAVFALFSILLVAIFTRIQWGQKKSLIATSLLAVNHTFFTYSRIGHVESIVGFFLLASFFCVTLEKKKYHFLAGILFSLAVLTKLTSFYSILAFAIYYSIDYYYGKRKIGNAVSFLIGGATIGVPFMIFYIIPFYNLLKPTLDYLRNPFLLRHLPDRILNFFQQPLFGQPGVYFLVILALLSGKPKDPVTKVAWSWIIGTTIVLTLWSDFADRRFIPFIIPLTLLAVQSLYNIKEKSINLPNIFYLIPIGSFLAWILGKKLCLNILPIVQLISTNLAQTIATKNTCAVSSYAFTTGIFLALPFVYLVLRKNPNLKGIALFAAIFLMTISLLNTLTIPYAVLLAALVGLVITMNFKHDKMTTALTTIFVVINATLIIITLLTPTFTVRDASREIAKLAPEGSVILGPGAHQLTLENNYHPLYWTPHWKHVNVNTNAINYSPKLLLFDPTDTTSWPTPNDINGKLVRNLTLQPGNVFLEIYSLT